MTDYLVCSRPWKMVGKPTVVQNAHHDQVSRNLPSVLKMTFAGSPQATFTLGEQDDERNQWPSELL